MKLTVGPLSPAVYWRRRAVVLGGLLLAVIMLTYSCSGSGASSSPRGASATSSGTPAAVSDESSSAPLTPTSGQPPAPTDTATPTAGTAAATGTPGAQAAPGPTGPCADTEILLTPVPAPASAKLQQPVRITFKIKNISNRACTRDVGADPQELYIQQGSTKVWSSDACEPAHGTDVRTFDPGVETTFAVVWDGRRTDAGCTNRPWAAAGSYQVLGRLATKLSEPVALTVST